MCCVAGSVWRLSYWTIKRSIVYKRSVFTIIVIVRTCSPSSTPSPTAPRDFRKQWSRHMRPVSGPLDDTHGRPATRSSCHPRPETRTPKSEYRCDARTVEHLQTSMGCVRVRIRSRPRRLVITILPMSRRRIGAIACSKGTHPFSWP